MRACLPCLLMVAIGPLFAWQPAGDPQADQYFPLLGHYAASHILIAYKGADKAKDSVTRSRREAKVRAEEVMAEVQAEPARFEAFARQYSDGPTSVRGGDLGAFNRREMAPAFEDALGDLEPGQIAPEPVRTAFGYHIIRRNDIMAKHYTARQILMVHNEAQVIRGVEDENAYRRTRDEARAALEALRPKLTAENFAAMADKHGDFLGHAGFMGVFKRGTSPVTEQAMAVLEDMDYGEISEIVDLPIGYALLLRQKVVKLKASQILIAYAGADGAKADVERDKTAAKAEAERIAGLLEANPTQFEELAKDHSDGIFAVRGGLMATWFRGYQPAAVEAVIESLDVGQVSTQVIESPKGFHLIRREAL